MSTSHTTGSVSKDSISKGPISNGSAGGTQTLLRGLHVLEALAGQDQPIGVGELSRILQLPKSTVQRLLRTLEQAGWAEVSPGPGTRWRIGPRILSVARRGLASKPLQETAAPHLARLGELTGETIHLAVPDGSHRLVLIDRVDSVQAVRTFNAIGASMALHTSSSGKAFLSKLPDDEIAAILSQPLEKVMPHTITDPEVIWAHIETARKVGYAVNESENRPGVCAVGAAITGPAGRPVATITISMPESRFDPEKVPAWGELVRQASEAISNSL